MLNCFSFDYDQIPFIEISKDPDFSEKFKALNIFELNFGKSQGFDDSTVSDYLKLDKMDKGLIPPTPRKVISKLFVDEKSYDAYDEFLFLGQRYVYAVQSNHSLNKFQNGCIISIDADGKAALTNELLESSVITFYTVYSRMFSLLPFALSQSALNLFEETYRKEQDQIINKYPNNPTGELMDRCNEELREIEKKYQDIEKVLKNKRYEHLTPKIIGYIKHGFKKKAIAITNSIDQVFVIDTKISNIDRLIKGNTEVIACDSKYEKYVGFSRYNVSTHDCKIKTPFDGYTIADIVKIKDQSNRFVVLAFKRIKKNIDFLEKIPVYFLVEKNSNDLLDISIIPEDKLNYYLIDCGLIERFALKMTLIEKMFGVVFPE